MPSDTRRMTVLFEDQKRVMREIEREVDQLRGGRDHQVTVEGEHDAGAAMRILLARSASFNFRPLPDDLFVFSVKEESVHAIEHLRTLA